MKNALRNSVLLMCATLFAHKDVKSQTIALANFDSTSFYEMSLTDLLNMEISVATQKPLSLRESPGIVTLITEEEIRNSGANDLIAVLRMVPGIEFGCDVQGVVGIGVRGNWAHEGKALLLWDGHPLNENLYSSMQFGNHYPVDRIKKIEIIRGPGSAIYGGYAEYAVINIISKNDNEFNGIEATASYGQMKNTFSHRNLTLSAGRSHGDLSCNISLFAGEGNRSDRNYSDNSGTTYNMAGDSKLNPMFGEMNIAWKNFSVSALYDNYYSTTRDGYDNVTQIAYPNLFRSYSVQGKYKFELKNNFTIIPMLNYRYELPWNFTDAPYAGDDYPTYDMSAERTTFNITALKTFSKKTDVFFGYEIYRDRAHDRTGSSYFSNGNSEIAYTNSGAFVQGMVQTKIANFTAGARYNYNTDYPSSFVPRIAVTRAFSRVHLKALYSKAFRTPSIENINAGMDIKPEKTTTVEFETGWNVNDFWSLTANVFDITTSDPIIYFYETEDAYKNGTENGTRGFEFSTIYKINKLHFAASYSYYTTAGKTTVDDYKAGQGKNYVLAFPNHKVNLTLNYSVSQNVSLCYTHTWLSERQTYFGTDSDGSETFTSLAPQHLGNISCSVKNIFTQGMTVSLGVNNIYNAQVLYIQPYKTNHAPLPGISREVQLSIYYNFNFGSR